MSKKTFQTHASIILIIGILLLLSPVFLHWFIHGDYNRYIWIINGPFPFSNFGSGPFQLMLGACLFILGLIVTTFAVFSSDKRAKTFKTTLLICIALLIFGFAFVFKSGSNHFQSLKTYQGDTYQFNYPSDWPLIKVAPSKGCDVCIDEVVFSFVGDAQSGDDDIAVIFVSKENRYTNNQYLDSYKNDSSRIELKDVLLGGNKAISYRDSGGIPPLQIIEYTTLRNGIKYSMWLVDSKETNKNREKNIAGFNELVSSFKFKD